MRPWSLRGRLDEREIAELITAYRNGATAASLATTHGATLKSVTSYAPPVSAARHPPEDPRRPHRPPRIRSPSCPALTARTAAWRTPELTRCSEVRTQQ
jgi:hypothetical protein